MGSNSSKNKPTVNGYQVNPVPARNGNYNNNQQGRNNINPINNSYGNSTQYNSNYPNSSSTPNQYQGGMSNPNPISPNNYRSPDQYNNANAKNGAYSPTMPTKNATGNYSPIQTRNPQPMNSPTMPNKNQQTYSPTQPGMTRPANGQTYNPNSQYPNPPSNGQYNNDRRPINPNDRTDIYNSQPRNANQYNTNTNMNTNTNARNQQPVPSQTNPSNRNAGAAANRQNGFQPSPPANQRNNNNNNFNNNSFNNTLNGSQTLSLKSNDFGPRIARRELWWKEPERQNSKIPFSQPLRIENITPRVDDKNPNYVPSRPQHRTIESRKLEWSAQPITDTWGNIRHKPNGKPFSSYFIIYSNAFHLHLNSFIPFFLSHSLLFSFSP